MNNFVVPVVRAIIGVLALDSNDLIFAFTES
jgi:hypothetical protein